MLDLFYRRLGAVLVVRDTVSNVENVCGCGCGCEPPYKVEGVYWRV